MSALVLSNTIMGLAAGASLLLLVQYARIAGSASPAVRTAWAWTFGILGVILLVVGLHTILAWPLLGSANLIFGDPAVLFGALLIAAAYIIDRTTIDQAGDEIPPERTGIAEFPEELMVALRPVAYVGAFGGLMVILLGWAGGVFGTVVFRPPSAEFPTGLVAGTGLEIVYMVGTYSILGIGAIVLPFGLHRQSLLRYSAYLLVAAGLLILFITMISFVGHVSLSKGAPPGGVPWPP